MPPPASPAPAPAPGAEPPGAVRRELVATWALAIAGISAAWAASAFVPLLRGNVAGVAAFLFIVLPDRKLAARGERWAAYGAPGLDLRDARTRRAWGRGAAAGLLACAVVFPVFALGYWASGELLRLPAGLAPQASPPAFHLRLPDGFALLAITQVLVVALPEELFYRGWMQTRWASTAPERGVTVLGARLGAGFLWTQLLFAAGHLVALQPWRLATFFPGLLFGWLRARTGTIVAPVVAHALSNLLLATLQRSFSG